MSAPDMTKVARFYLSRGISVFPLLPRGKNPHAELLPIKTDDTGNAVLNEYGKPVHTWKPYQARRATPEEAVNWFTRAPDANIAIACGAISGLVVLDIDGKEGMGAMRELGGVPATPYAQTGKGEGHFHVCFKHPGFECGNFAKKVPGLDFRGDGGYIVAAPSIHPNGQPYRWIVKLSDAPLADAPDWLIEFIKAPERPKLPPPEFRISSSGDYAAYTNKAVQSEVERLLGVGGGARNDELTRGAYRLGRMIGAGMLDYETARGALEQVIDYYGGKVSKSRDCVERGLRDGADNPRQLPPLRARQQNARRETTYAK